MSFVRGLWLVGALLVCLAFVSAGAWWLGSAFSDGFLLAVTVGGRTGEAVITDIHIAGVDGERRTRISYQFLDASGTAFYGTSALPAAAADTLRVQHRLPVLYARDHPSWSTAVPFQAFVAGDLAFRFLFGLFSLAFGGSFAFISFRLFRDRWQRLGFPGVLLD